MVNEIDIFLLRGFDTIQEGIQESLALPENLFGTALGPNMDADIMFSAIGIAHDVEDGLTDYREVPPGEREGRPDFVLDLFLNEELAYLSREMRWLRNSFTGVPRGDPAGLRGPRRLDR
jgi:hypothetical protein